jgi:hypothetical protein
MILAEWLEKIDNSGYLIRRVEINGKISDDHIEYGSARDCQARKS